MSKEGNKVAIGAFVAGALALAVAGVMTFGSGILFRDKETYIMYFDGDLKGLNVGAPVAFRGVRVGEVTDISVFIDSDTLIFSVPVMVEIDSRRFHHTGKDDKPIDAEADLKILIKKGMRAELSLQSIVTGQLMIQLGFHPDMPANLKTNGQILEIPTIPSNFERLAQALEKISFRELVDNINEAVKQLGSLLDKNELQKVVDSIKTAADNIAVLSNNLNNEAIPLIQSLKRTADETQLLVRDVNQQVDPVAVDAQKALDAFQQAMEQADQTLKSIDTLAEGYTESSAFHYEVSNALREIAAAASSLRAFTDMLQQQPEALIRGKANPGGP